MTLNLYGTNEEYRQARGTDQPFNDAGAAAAWADLRRQWREAKEASITKAMTLKDMDKPKPRPARRVKVRKHIASDGSIRVCSTGL